MQAEVREEGNIPFDNFIDIIKIMENMNASYSSHNSAQRSSAENPSDEIFVSFG